jgi:hypothetical protein
MTYAEAVKRMDDSIGDAYAHRQSIVTQKGYTLVEAKKDADLDDEALAVLRRAEPLLEAVEKAVPDLLYGDAYGTISGSGASVLIAALAYRSAKEKP